MYNFVYSKHGDPLSVSLVPLGVLPAAFLENEHLLGLRGFLDGGEHASLLHCWATHARVVLSAHQQHIFQLELSANLIRQQLAHYSVILRHLVLQALNTHHSEDLLWVCWQHDTLLRLVHIEHLILLFLFFNWVKQSLFFLDLFTQKGLFPLVHDALVLFVYVEFVVHRSHGLLVHFFEELAETSCSHLHYRSLEGSLQQLSSVR